MENEWAINHLMGVIRQDEGVMFLMYEEICKLRGLECNSGNIGDIEREFYFKYKESMK